MISIILILVGFLFISAPIVYYITKKNNPDKPTQDTKYYCTSENKCDTVPSTAILYKGEEACNTSCKK